MTTNNNNIMSTCSKVLTTMSGFALAAEFLTGRHCHCHSFRPSLWMCTPGYYALPYRPAYQPYYPGSTIHDTYYPKKKTQTPENLAVKVPESQNSTLGINLLKGNNTQFVTENWVLLDEKENKTNSENMQLVSKYRGFLNNFAKSFISALDYKTNIGNKNGEISKEEFVQYYTILFTDENSSNETLNDLKMTAEELFNNLNIHKGNGLNTREIAVLFAIADQINDSKYDGKISAKDIKAALTHLSKAPNKTELIQKTFNELYLNG